MSSEYYTLEEAANVLKLPTAEVNRLREKNSLRAFRDGSSWKFKKPDVDAYLAEIIKSRGVSKSAAESDFDLLSADGDDEAATMLSDQQSFDSLMEDNDGLSLDDSKLISATPAAPQASPQDDFEGLMIDEENDFSLTDDSSIIIPVQQTTTPSEKQAQAASASDVDLAADDLIPGSSVNLAGDSGISLLKSDDGSGEIFKAMGSDVEIQFDDESDILSLVDSNVPAEHTTTIAIPVEDDFLLTPNSKGMSVDESESSSQVIALDVSSGSGSQVIALEEDNPFGMQGTPAPFVSAPALEQPMENAGFGNAFGDVTSSYATPSSDFAAVSPLNTVPAKTEASYSPILVTVLILTTFFLVLPGMMVLDLIIHIWSWGEPFIINSSMMDLFAGMAGLK